MLGDNFSPNFSPRFQFGSRASIGFRRDTIAGWSALAAQILPSLDAFFLSNRAVELAALRTGFPQIAQLLCVSSSPLSLNEV